MFKAAFTGRSETGSSSQRKKASNTESGVSTSSRWSDDESRRTERTRGYNDDSSVYKPSRSSRNGDSRGPSESVSRLANDGDWEDDERDTRTDRKSKRDGDKRRDRGAEKDRNGKGDDAKRSSRKDSEGSRGKSRGLNEGNDRAIPDMGSFEQFPGQYSGGVMGNAGQQTDFMMSGALSSADNQFGPTRADTFGAAADYYQDEGQSVSAQPGMRAKSPNMLVNPDQHLMAASMDDQPAQDTGHGSAADFYGGKVSPIPFDNKPSATDPASSGRPKPSKTSSLGSAAAAAAIGAAGMALGFGSKKPSQKPSQSGSPSQSQSQYGTSSVSYEQQSGGSMSSSRPPRRPNRQNSAPVTSGSANAYYDSTQQQQFTGSSGKQSSQTNSGMYAAGAAAAVGAAGLAAYEMHEHNKPNQQQQPQQRPQEQTSYETTNSRYDSTQYGRPSAYGSPQVLTVNDGGAAGIAQEHFHEHKGPMTRLKDGLLNLVSTEEDVIKMEMYTEYIGVCRYCFDPRTTPYDAPRVHHYHTSSRRDSFESLRKRRSVDRMKRSSREYLMRTNSNRVDKDSRYYSSDTLKHRQSTDKAGLAAAGIAAAAGTAAVANVMSYDRKNFDDTYSIKSGHRESSPAGRGSRSSSGERRRRSSYGATGEDVKDEYVAVRTKDGRLEKRKVRRSRSRSKDGKDNLAALATGAALAGGAVAASSSRHSRRQWPRQGRRSRSSSRSNSPGGFFGFFSPSRKSKKRRDSRSGRQKKQGGFFSFSNDSFSTDSELAFGASRTDLPLRRKSSTKITTKRRNSDERIAATVAGLGATAAALAAAQNGRRFSPGKGVPELGAKRNVRITHHSAPDRRHGSPGSSEDEWVDELPSDVDDASSAEEGLAYGDHGRHQPSRPNQSVSGAGLADWKFRTNDGRKSDLPATPSVYSPRPNDSNYIGGMKDRPLRSEARMSSTSGILQRPMQEIDPRPILDAGSFSGSRHASMPGAWDQTTSYNRPSPAPIQQPKPITPIQPAFTQSPPPMDSNDLPRPYPPRRTQSSPTQSNFYKDAAIIGAAAVGTAGIIAAQGRKSSNVRFGLTEEQERKHERDQQREQEKANDERQRGSREQAARDEALRRTRERDVLERREAENRRAAEAKLERQRADEREAEQRAELDRQRQRNKEQEGRDQVSSGRRYSLPKQRSQVEDPRTRDSSQRSGMSWEAVAAGAAAAGAGAYALRECDERKKERASHERVLASAEHTDLVRRMHEFGEAGSDHFSKTAHMSSTASSRANDSVSTGDQERDRRSNDYDESRDAYIQEIRPPSADIDGKPANDDIYDPEYFRRGARSPADYAKHLELARKAASKVTDVEELFEDHDAYYTEDSKTQAEFFAPEEILAKKAEGKEKAANPVEDNEIQVYRRANDEVHAEFAREWAVSPSGPKQFAPFGVPKLGLVSPTPPPFALTARRRSATSPSPLSRVQTVESDTVAQASRSSSRNRSVSWGADQTHVYDVPTPEAEHEKESYIDEHDASRAGAAVAAAAAVTGIAVATAAVYERTDKSRDEQESSVKESSKPVEGFIEGELQEPRSDPERRPHVPGGFDDADEYTSATETPEVTTTSSRLASTTEADQMPETPDTAIKTSEEEVESLPSRADSAPSKLSKKEKRKLEKAAKRKITSDGGLVTSATDEGIETPTDPAATPSQARKSAQSSSQNRHQGFANIAEAVMTAGGIAAVTASMTDSQNDTSRSKKDKKSKKSREIERDPRDIEPEPAEEPAALSSSKSEEIPGTRDNEKPEPVESPTEVVDPFQYQILDRSPSPPHLKSEPTQDTSMVTASATLNGTSRAKMVDDATETDDTTLVATRSQDRSIEQTSTADNDFEPEDSTRRSDSPDQMSPDVQSVTSDPSGDRRKRTSSNAKRSSSGTKYYDEPESYDDGRSVAASEPADLRRSKRRSRSGDDLVGSRKSSRSKRDIRDQSSLKDKKTGIFGGIFKRKNGESSSASKSDGASLSRRSTRDSNGGNSAGKDRSRRERRSGSEYGDEDDSRSTTSEHRHHYKRSTQDNEYDTLQRDDDENEDYHRHNQRRTTLDDEFESRREDDYVADHHRYHHERGTGDYESYTRTQADDNNDASKRYSADEYETAHDRSFLGRRVGDMPPLPDNSAASAASTSLRTEQESGMPVSAESDHAVPTREHVNAFELIRHDEHERSPADAIDLIRHEQHDASETPVIHDQDPAQDSSEAITRDVTMQDYLDSPAESLNGGTTQRRMSLNRPLSTTAIPLRFPFGSQQPLTPSPRVDRNVSFGGSIPTSPATPASGPRTRQGRPGSTEIRPLYLVELNRKPQELDDGLPSLPSSKPSSRASSQIGSDEYESAAEEVRSPEGRRDLRIDTGHANVYQPEADYLDSQQTTPRASEPPNPIYERSARPEPQFYTWEDYAREVSMRSAVDTKHSGQNEILDRISEASLERTDLRQHEENAPNLTASGSSSPHRSPKSTGFDGLGVVAATATLLGGAALLAHGATNNDQGQPQHVPSPPVSIMSRRSSANSEYFVSSERMMEEGEALGTPAPIEVAPPSEPNELDHFLATEDEMEEGSIITEDLVAQPKDNTEHDTFYDISDSVDEAYADAAQADKAAISIEKTHTDTMDITMKDAPAPMHDSISRAVEESTAEPQDAVVENETGAGSEAQAVHGDDDAQLLGSGSGFSKKSSKKAKRKQKATERFMSDAYDVAAVDSTSDPTAVSEPTLGTFVATAIESPEAGATSRGQPTHEVHDISIAEEQAETPTAPTFEQEDDVPFLSRKKSKKDKKRREQSLALEDPVEPVEGPNERVSEDSEALLAPTFPLSALTCDATNVTSMRQSQILSEGDSHAVPSQPNPTLESNERDLSAQILEAMPEDMDFTNASQLNPAVHEAESTTEDVRKRGLDTDMTYALPQKEDSLAATHFEEPTAGPADAAAGSKDPDQESASVQGDTSLTEPFSEDFTRTPSSKKKKAKKAKRESRQASVVPPVPERPVADTQLLDHSLEKSLEEPASNKEPAPIESTEVEPKESQVDESQDFWDFPTSKKKKGKNAKRDSRQAYLTPAEDPPEVQPTEGVSESPVEISALTSEPVETEKVDETESPGDPKADEPRERWDFPTSKKKGKKAKRDARQASVLPEFSEESTNNQPTEGLINQSADGPAVAGEPTSIDEIADTEAQPENEPQDLWDFPTSKKRKGKKSKKTAFVPWSEAEEAIPSENMTDSRTTTQQEAEELPSLAAERAEWTIPGSFPEASDPPASAEAMEEDDTSNDRAETEEVEPEQVELGNKGDIEDVTQAVELSVSNEDTDMAETITDAGLDATLDRDTIGTDGKIDETSQLSLRQPTSDVWKSPVLDDSIGAQASSTVEESSTANESSMAQEPEETQNDEDYWPIKLSKKKSQKGKKSRQVIEDEPQQADAMEGVEPNLEHSITEDLTSIQEKPATYGPSVVEESAEVQDDGTSWPTTLSKKNRKKGKKSKGVVEEDSQQADSADAVEQTPEPAMPEEPATLEDFAQQTTNTEEADIWTMPSKGKKGKKSKKSVSRDASDQVMEGAVQESIPGEPHADDSPSLKETVGPQPDDWWESTPSKGKKSKKSKKSAAVDLEPTSIDNLPGTEADRMRDVSGDMDVNFVQDTEQPDEEATANVPEEIAQGLSRSAEDEKALAGQSDYIRPSITSADDPGAIKKAQHDDQGMSTEGVNAALQKHLGSSVLDEEASRALSGDDIFEDTHETYDVPPNVSSAPDEVVRVEDHPSVFTEPSVTQQMDIEEPEPEIATPFVVKKSKKDKKKDKKSRTTNVESTPEETSSKPITGVEADESRDTPLAGPIDTDAEVVHVEEPTALPTADEVQEDDWVGFSTKRSKRDKRKSKKRESTVAFTPEPDESSVATEESGLAGAHMEETRPVMDNSNTQPSAQNLSPEPASSVTLPSSHDERDLDFAATVAAGLASSNFNSDIVMGDPDFSRRTSPPGVAEADPEEIFHTSSGKRKKERKAKRDADFSDAIDTYPVPSVPGLPTTGGDATDDVDETVKRALKGTGFDPAILQEAISSNNSASEGEAAGDAEFTFAAPRRKKSKKSKQDSTTTSSAFAAPVDDDGTRELDRVELQEDILETRDSPRIHDTNLQSQGIDDDVNIAWSEQALTAERIRSNDTYTSDADILIAGERDMDVEEMDNAYRALKRSKRDKKKAAAKNAAQSSQSESVSEAEPTSRRVHQDVLLESDSRYATASSRPSRDAPSMSQPQHQAATIDKPDFDKSDMYVATGALGAALGAGLAHSDSRHRRSSPSPHRSTSSRHLGLLPGDRRHPEHGSTWSFSNVEDEGMHMTDSPVVDSGKHEFVPDSGYQEADSPLLQRHSVYSTASSMAGVRAAHQQGSTHRRSSEEQGIGDYSSDWNMNVAKHRGGTAEHTNETAHTRTASRETSNTPLESTTKNRASYLFQTTPENLRDAGSIRSNSPTPHPRSIDMHTSEHSRVMSPVSPESGHGTRAPLGMIVEEHQTHGQKRPVPENGEHDNEGAKTLRRSETPPSIRSRAAQISSPDQASRRRTAGRTSVDLRSPSAMSNQSNTSAGAFRAPEELRSYSRASNCSSTPTLRRSSLSGDLRAERLRGETGSAVGARASPKTIPFEPPPTPPLNDDEVDEGASHSATMSDVYQGYGDAEASQVSPTRPPNVRKRQSMHVMELESKLDQLVAENRALKDARQGGQFSVGPGNLPAQLNSRDLQLREKDNEINQIRTMLESLQDEVARLNEINGGLTDANRSLVDDSNGRYGTLQQEHAHAHEQWENTSRELQDVRQEHDKLNTNMREVVETEVATALAEKNSEIRQLRKELDVASEKIRALQTQIQNSRGRDILVVRDEDYFDGACQKLCQHVQQWVLRFSKLSDDRRCRLSTEVNDDKIEARLDNAIVDGSDVDKLLSDRIRRRDVFMSVVMTMVWEYVFTRYLFGMDREQRKKLKDLEKLLEEVGPRRAVAQWRATTLTLLSKRPAFTEQRERDTEAVSAEIFDLLRKLLPPPSNTEQQLQASLQRVVGIAVDLSVEMRCQKAEYVMLPPLQPEYDTNGDLTREFTFNAALMNERSGMFSSNGELEQTHAVVKIVLFPLVVKKGDDYGEGSDEIVVCPAQVLVQNENARGKRVVRVQSGAMEIDDPRRSTNSLASHGGSTAF